MHQQTYFPEPKMMWVKQCLSTHRFPQLQHCQQQGTATLSPSTQEDQPQVDHIRPSLGQLLHSSTAEAQRATGHAELLIPAAVTHDAALQCCSQLTGQAANCSSIFPTAIQVAQVPGQLHRRETPSAALIYVHQTLAARAHQGAEQVQISSNDQLQALQLGHETKGHLQV